MRRSNNTDNLHALDVYTSILDKWTDISLEAYWKELVKIALEINNTGHTSMEDSTGPN